MEILGNVESKMQMFRSRVKSTIRRATTKQWISAGYLTNTCCSTGSPIYMGWVHFWDFAVKKIFYRLYGWMHSNLTAPPPPPPPKKMFLEGVNCRAPYSPPKKYTEKDIGSRLLCVTFNRQKKQQQRRNKIYWGKRHSCDHCDRKARKVRFGLHKFHHARKDLLNSLQNPLIPRILRVMRIFCSKHGVSLKTMGVERKFWMIFRTVKWEFIKRV